MINKIMKHKKIPKFNSGIGAESFKLGRQALGLLHHIETIPENMALMRDDAVGLSGPNEGRELGTWLVMEMPPPHLEISNIQER